MKAIKGKYKKGKIELNEIPKGIEESEVIVVFTKTKITEKVLNNVKKALREVKLMQKGELAKKDARELLNELQGYNDKTI